MKIITKLTPLAMKSYFALCKVHKVACIYLTEKPDGDYLSYEHDFHSGKCGGVPQKRLNTYRMLGLFKGNIYFRRRHEPTQL